MNVYSCLFILVFIFSLPVLSTVESIQQPRIFNGKLKEYQLVGLKWLVNLYEQGLFLF